MEFDTSEDQEQVRESEDNWFGDRVKLWHWSHAWN